MNIHQVIRAKQLRAKGFNVRDIAAVLRVDRREVFHLVHGRNPPARTRADKTDELVAALMEDVPPGRDPIEHRKCVLANFGGTR